MGSFSFIKEKLKASRIFNFNVVERDKWVLDQARSILPGSKILDIGAGSSPYRKYFEHCIFKTQDFCQLNPKQLRFRKGYSAIDYVSEAHQIPVPDASFDVILLTEVLEHVPNPVEVIREISRIIKPGGRLILTAPLGSGLHQQPFHFYGGYTPFWYGKYLTENHFSDIMVTPNGNFFKFFGQETQRMIQMSFPLSLSSNMLVKLIWFPFWLLILPFWFITPLVCNFLDRYDKNKTFTIGYHVTAIKQE